jgi:hypothetical protein
MSQIPPWPLPDAYIAGKQVLGFDFSYPPQYLQAIEWAHGDVDAGGDGHALAFLRVEDVKHDLSFVKQATSKKLVPFARGDNGDALYCFAAIDSSKVYVIDLGDRRLRARELESQDFVSFLNVYRANLGMPPWEPR